MAICLDKEQVQRAAEMLAKAQKIVILTHVAPDGDAMGSALALWHFCKDERMKGERMKGERSVTVIVPNAFPAFFNWMPGVEQILIYENSAEACNKAIAEADLFLCTDFNDPKRISPAGDKMMENPCPKIMMDHHPNPMDFADIRFSFPQSSSASEIVYRLIEAISDQPFAISLPTATCLYTGLMTDTGNFSYNSSDPELYEIVAQLLRAGVQKDKVYNAVFNQYSTDRTRLTGYALYRKMRIYPEYHLALIALTADELDQFHYQTGDCEGLVNMPLQIADVHYSVFMREERPKPGTPRSRIRVSFRSQGDRPVNIWANEVFHGGGHMNASGGELFGSIPQAVRLFEKTFPDYLKKD